MGPATEKSVLVVDDEPVDVIVVQKSLEKAGYRVWSGSDYAKGLEVFQSHADEIDVLIADVSLPDKTGIDLAKDCLRLKRTLKILFISGWAGAEFLDYAGISKEDLHFLPKPFRSSKLVSRVAEVLASTDRIPWLEMPDTAGCGE
ncbi:MAG TPA: response regulator [Bryobacteraceae bacterium]|jgi:CheY-like chemotaxis protein